MPSQVQVIYDEDEGVWHISVLLKGEYHLVARETEEDGAKEVVDILLSWKFEK